MSRIDPGQTARHHGSATIAAVTAVSHVTRDRRSGAEKARGGGGKHAESLFSVHGLLLLLAVSGPRNLVFSIAARIADFNQSMGCCFPYASQLDLWEADCRKILTNYLILLVSPAGFEPTTP
jgi:hypothetical protein